MLLRLAALLSAILLLQGCIVGTAVGVTGDIAEGAVKTTAFTVKTTGKAAGAVLPGGGDDDEDDKKK